MKEREGDMRETNLEIAMSVADERYEIRLSES